MIKVIAFDLVGVLVKEKEIELTEEEAKFERLFGPNLSDSEYLIEARKINPKDVVVMRTTVNLLNNLYEVKDDTLLSRIREKYPELAMKGIFTSCVSSATIDESPMAYKPMDEIIVNIEPTCTIEKIIKPVYNFKAAF